MEFLQLKYFQHAAKTENFSHTAKHFMVPPSSISLTIKRLESELGTCLFDRYGNTVKLNQKGQVFLTSVNNIFAELTAAKNNLNKLTGTPFGIIRMLVITNRRIITEIISNFRAEYPDISFILDMSKKNSYSNYDIIVTDADINTDNFYSKKFVDEEILLAVPSSNPISSKHQIEMRALKEESFISFSPDHSLRNITNDLCSQAGFSPNIVIECNDPFYIREYVKMGMGISLVPSLSWKNQFDTSVMLLKINDGICRHSRIYVNNNSSYSAGFFAQYMLSVQL